MGDYNLVSFENIPKSYPVEAHIECKYTLKPGLVSSKYDWVGLFRVGWSSTRDSIIYYWAPCEPEKETHSVLFQSSNLPKEDGEFYQFVYFNAKGQMKGASSPFQFRKPQSEDYVEEEMEDDSEMLVITSRQVQLEEKFQAVQQKCESLTQAQKALDLDRQRLLEKLALTEGSLREKSDQKAKLVKHLQEFERTTKDKDDELQRRQKQCTISSERCQQLSEVVEKLEFERDSLFAELETQGNEIRSLRNELDSCAGQVKALSEEKELYRKHLDNAENTKQLYQTEVVRLKEQLEKTALVAEELELVQTQHNSAEDTISLLKKTGEEHTALLESLTSQLSAAEARRLVYDETIGTLNETLSSMSSNLETAKSENHSLKNKLRKAKESAAIEKARQAKDWEDTLAEMEKDRNGLISNIGELKHEIDRIKQVNMELPDYTEQEDRYEALRVAYTMLKEELSSQNKELEKKKRQEAKLVESERKAKDQINALQGKLKLGHAEWTRLAAEKQKVEKQLKKSQTEFDWKVTLQQTEVAGAVGSTASDLTKEELSKMVEQLGKELELRTLKKEKYKEKYLAEKQRAATLRDYYTGEIQKYANELEVAKKQQGSAPPIPPRTPKSPSENSRAKMASPTVFPRQLSAGSGDTNQDSKDVMEEEIGAVSEFLLPCPMEPIKTPVELPATSEKEKPIDGPSELRVDVENEESDEENENPDRFHDAVEDPASGPLSCCVCHKQFNPDENMAMRNAHINEHLEQDSRQEDDDEFYRCPMCSLVVPKSEMTADEFSTHVEAHLR